LRIPIWDTDEYGNCIVDSDTHEYADGNANHLLNWYGNGNADSIPVTGNDLCKPGSDLYHAGKCG